MNCKDNVVFISRFLFKVLIQPPLDSPLDCTLSFLDSHNHFVQLTYHKVILAQTFQKKCVSLEIIFGDETNKVFTYGMYLQSLMFLRGLVANLWTPLH